MSRTAANLTYKRCRCPSCGEVFSTVANFDRHRKGAHGIDRHCVDPELVGMKIGGAEHGGYWQMPGRDK